MPTYRKPNADERALLGEAIRKYHDRLIAYGVTIDLLVAYATRTEKGEMRGTAISHGGYAAMATVKVNPLKARVLGSGDALVTIDGDRWIDFEEAEHLAILDHELTHLDLVYDDDGELPAAVIEAAEANPTKERPRPIRLDDEGRPRLRIRLHDHQFGWFDDVVKRHGRQSVEWGQFEKFRGGSLEQLWLPGLDAPTGASEESPRRKGRKGAA